MHSFIPEQARQAINLKKKVQSRYAKSLFGVNQPNKATPNFPKLMLSPFETSQLNPVPKDWEISGPDYVGIGVPKAGTSWWNKILREHPQVQEHRLFSEQKEQGTKELQYFAHFGYQGMGEDDGENYSQAFAKPHGSICGEWSPLYLCQPFCIEYLAQAAPSTKVLVMLRNPIDRTVSHLNHILKNRVKNFNFSSEQTYMFETYSLYPEVFFHSLYSNALRQLLKHFNRENILLLQYEKCKLDPEKEAARTYHFLGINDQYKPKSLIRKVNQQGYLIPKLDLEDRHRMAEYFIDDVKATANLFSEIDLSLWFDFSQSNQIHA